MFKTIYKAIIFIAISGLSFATIAAETTIEATIEATTKAATKVEEGKDYQLVPAKAAEAIETQADKILIQEFFSYGCPWCAKIEPELSSWRKEQPAYIQVQKIPVLFKSGWDFYAKAYYTAQALGLDEKLGPTLFDHIINKKTDLKSNKSMIAFFKSQGVDESVVKNAFTSSITIDSRVANGIKIMKTYQIYTIPSIIVDGKYSTSLASAQGDSKRLIEIVDALVAKVKEEKNIKK